jgi:four helix bundle protein
MDSVELRSRTKALAVSAIVAANYRAACRARSRADFANKMGIVEEEADETLFWLEMLIECKKARHADLKVLMDEAEQLLRIFAASRMTAKAHAAVK